MTRMEPLGTTSKAHGVHMAEVTITGSSVAEPDAEFVWESAGHAHAHQFILPVLCAQLARHSPRDILDLGAGNGTLTAYLDKLGYTVTGLDNSRSGLEMAQRSFPAMRFERYDIDSALPAAHVGKYDCVVSIEVIEHLLLPRKLMEAARQALRPGGWLVVTTPFHGYWKNLALALTGKFDNHWRPLLDFGHVKFFSRKTLTSLFEEFGFESIEFASIGRVAPLARSMLVAGRKPK
jgi:2-polyprenyl-3-methyl-5-hydroxy-6-metoxy-1,4-benzoquinol methylase